MQKVATVLTIVFGFYTLAWAADTKLSALTNLGAAPANTDEVYLNDAGTSKALTVANLFLYLGAAHDTEAELTALFAAKEVQLDNEAGLYAVLSDVADFVQTEEINTLAELETVSSGGAYMSDMLAATSEANFKSITNLEIGTDVLAEQTIGITDDNLMEVDDADAADDDYAKFTANGLEGRSYAEVLSDIGAESATSNDIDPDRLAGDTTDDNLIDTGILGTFGAIAIDGTPASDNTYGGITITGYNCGETLAQWDLVELVNDTDPWHKADATAGSGEYPAFGISVAACVNGNAATILVKGIVRNDAWNWTSGSPLYLGDVDDGGDGSITAGAPDTSNDAVQIVGWAITDDEVYFDFSRPYQLVE